MSKAQQTKLNIDLSDKLANFLITQRRVMKLPTSLRSGFLINQTA